MTKEQLWESILGELELILSRANFSTWFKDTFIVNWEEERIVVGVPNTFTQSWLQNKYHQPIQAATKNIIGKPVKEIVYQVASFKKQPTLVDSVQPKQSLDTATESKRPAVGNLNVRYKFDNFIVGKNNELAHAAGRAVAQKPGEVYNPFFIYGGVGLGKTHLIQAIGHNVLQHNPKAKVIYTSCENFTNQFVQSIKNGTTIDFQNQYRNVDVLIVDDIHFIAGKDQTQEQFFHTFNQLHQNNKQIIISSDRAVASIPSIEARLKSRFSWGMIADISQPDLETRMAILESKAAEKNININGDIVNYIATSIQSNIRELEGALNKIIAHFSLTQTKPNLDEAKQVLSSISQQTKKGALTPKQIIKTVSEFYDISLENILGASRKKGLVVPRQIAMYLMREEINTSFPTIGLETGNRDHTTVMHACKKITKEIQVNERLQQEIITLKQRLYNN